MKKKLLHAIPLSILFTVSILSSCLIGCSKSSVLKNQEDGTIKNTSTNESSSITPPADNEVKEEDNIIPKNTSEPFIGSKDLDSETQKLFYGTWKVEKLLGFANSYNDASEYPTGQKIIDDEIIINKDFFSSKGLKNYNNYQYELNKPRYEIATICYNKDSFYSLFKIDLPNLDTDDEIKWLKVYNSSTDQDIPVTFFVINNNKLIFLLEATVFELKKSPVK